MSRQKIAWGEIMKRMTPYNMKKGVLYLRQFGLKGFMDKLTSRFDGIEIEYADWFRKHQPDEKELLLQKNCVWKEKVKISIIVPLYCTPEHILHEMISSVKQQTYENWELCLVDASDKPGFVPDIVRSYMQSDDRIKYQKLSENKGISENMNKGIEMSSGDYLAFLDHDDMLAPSALYEVRKVIESNPWVDLIYTDEDKITEDGTSHFKPHFKPDFNPDLLMSNNYICHLAVMKRSMVYLLEGFRKEFDGAQDYDLFLRCSEKTHRILHVPKVLYHWRSVKTSTSEHPEEKQYAYDAGKRALQEALVRRGLKGNVEETSYKGFYRIQYQVEGNPKVSIIIPNQDHADSLKRCIDSIEEKTTWQNFEIIVVENNSQEKETLAYYKTLKQNKHVKVIRFQDPFNYSVINNYAVDFSKGDYLLFLNNDTEVITTGWIEEMLSNCQRPEVGIVGAKLFYPDGKIQHAGIVIGIGGVAGSMFVDMPGTHSGYMHKASIQQNLSAVTAACMMMKRSVFEKIGGFEEQLAVAFNDVDLCLRSGQAGFLTVYDPYVQLYHDESKTRGAEDSKEKIRRFQKEIEFMRGCWLDLLQNGDPNYNKNLSLQKWDYSLKNEG